MGQAWIVKPFSGVENPSVTLDPLKGIRSIQQIAEDHEVLPEQISKWTKTLSEGGSSVFGPNAGQAVAEDFERGRSGLHSKIGQLAMEVDFLERSHTAPPARDRTELVDTNLPS